MKSLGFVYVPKTGGTYLSVNSMPREYVYDSSAPPPKVHMSSSHVQSIIKEGTPIFTIVRDPYDRACSEYYYLKSKSSASIKNFTWNLENKIRMESISSSFSKTTGYKFFFEKICAIYDQDMSVEDYLEWSIDNSTYPIYYDTLTPKDFDIVGITEDIPRTIKLLRHMHDINAGMGDYNKNDNKNVNDPYQTKFPRSVFKSRNSIEYDLYHESIDKFNSLCKKSNIK